MRAQDIIEEARYMQEHGSIKGYKARFLYDDDLETLFHEAANKSLPAKGRAPVGLNPERFIARCEECKQWLHGCEFNVKFCENCLESKAAAADN